jgi:hypothetical protein
MPTSEQPPDPGGSDVSCRFTGFDVDYCGYECDGPVGKGMGIVIKENPNSPCPETEDEENVCPDRF